MPSDIIEFWDRFLREPVDVPTEAEAIKNAWRLGLVTRYPEDDEWAEQIVAGLV
jgi:hypothetical protein